MGFSKKNLNIIKVPKCGKFAVEWVSNGIISQKCHFRPNYAFLKQKFRKLWTWEKLEIRMKKECFFEKKTFSSFQSLLYKNGKAQNMPLVAGRVVSLIYEYWSKLNTCVLESFNFFLSGKNDDVCMHWSNIFFTKVKNAEMLSALQFDWFIKN